jgi:hypothetical protein
MACGGGGGQFLSGVRIDRPSGVYTNPYRAGDQTARVEIEALLQSGTSGGARLLAEIDAQRTLVVRAQPDGANPPYRIGRDGQIRLPGGMLAPAGPGVAGEWAAIDTSWAVASGAFGLQPGRVWLEGAAWTPGGGLRIGE